MTDDVNDGIEVVPNPAEQRFEIHVDGVTAGHSDYSRKGDLLIFTHTEIAPAFGGRGLGSTLARGALDAVRASGEAIVPLCPFIADFVEKHPEYDEMVDHECLAYLESRPRRRAAAADG